MSLTTSQRNQLRTAMQAIPSLADAILAGDTVTLLTWSNEPSATEAWRKDVLPAELYAAHKPKEYIARTAAERQAFDLMIFQGNPLDFCVPKIRNGVADIFSGTTNSSSRTPIFSAAKTFATNAEAVFGGVVESVGGTSDMAEVVSALDRTWVGEVEQEDINWIVSQVLQGV